VPISGIRLSDWFHFEAELAEWVDAERKCCPFFDFHIDLEREGSMLWLRLTGQNGIKQFIQMEFQLPKK
jgi:hypothetical protein